jgi:hypothetical protein
MTYLFRSATKTINLVWMLIDTKSVRNISLYNFVGQRVMVFNQQNAPS